MSLLSKLFAKKEDQYSDFNWIPLTEINQLDGFVKNSTKKTVVIFKHSTRCGISRNVLNQFEKTNKVDAIDFYFLDILNFREISNKIALKFKVEHQSPQVIAISNKLITHASHHHILDLDLTKL